MAPKTLVRIILILSAAFIIGVFVMGITKVMTKGGDVENCRTSIIAAAYSKKLPNLTGTGRPINNINCPRQEFILYKRDIVENGEINQDKAHKRIADAMAECWYMVGEGKMDPFSNWENKNKNYCLICKTIKFDKKLQNFIASHTNDLNHTYLIEEKGLSLEEANNTFRENIKKYTITSPEVYIKTQKKKNSKKTYFEYLYNEEPPTISQKDIEEYSLAPFIEGSSIIVSMYKYKAKSKTWKIVGIVGAAALLTGAIVLSGGFASAVIVPAVTTSLMGGTTAAAATAAATVATTTAAAAAAAGATTTATAALATAISITTATAAATATATAIVTGAALGCAASGILLTGITVNQAFKDCPDCEGHGSIKLIPPIYKFSTNQQICVEDCNTDNPEYKEAPLCSLIVN